MRRRFSWEDYRLRKQIGNRKLGARLRLVLREGVAFGPGKADLLEGIRDTGSIAAAGRGLGMSYTRAWGLVVNMNKEFRAPLVQSEKGGSARGGAALTRTGEEVLSCYRRIEQSVHAAMAKDIAALRRKLA